MRCNEIVISPECYVSCRVCFREVSLKNVRRIVFLQNKFWLCGSIACNRIALQRIVERLWNIAICHEVSRRMVGKTGAKHAEPGRGASQLGSHSGHWWRGEGAGVGGGCGGCNSVCRAQQPGRAHSLVCRLSEVFCLQRSFVQLFVLHFTE